MADRIEGRSIVRRVKRLHPTGVPAGQDELVTVCTTPRELPLVGARGPARQPPLTFVAANCAPVVVEPFRAYRRCAEKLLPLPQTGSAVLQKDFAFGP